MAKSKKSKKLNVPEEFMGKILYLSNCQYCWSAGDLQNALEKIHDLLKEQFPKLEENDDL